VQLSHAPAKTHATFDDEHLIAYAGLVPVMRLAERCGLAELAAEHVRMADPLGANTPLKIGSIVAGMVAGADSIDDLGLLRHGGMTKLFSGVRAPVGLENSGQRSDLRRFEVVVTTGMTASALALLPRH
jgi:hypothetical protein